MDKQGESGTPAVVVRSKGQSSMLEQMRIDVKETDVVDLSAAIKKIEDIDGMSGLSEEQRNAIKADYMRQMTELHIREKAVVVDGKELLDRAHTTVTSAVAADQRGLYVTETTTQQTETGRTEIIVGNTETASRGKLDRAQRGEKDLTLWYAVIAAAVVVALALLLR